MNRLGIVHSVTDGWMDRHCQTVDVIVPIANNTASSSKLILLN